MNFYALKRQEKPWSNIKIKIFFQKRERRIEKLSFSPFNCVLTGYEVIFSRILDEFDINEIQGVYREVAPKLDFCDILNWDVARMLKSLHCDANHSIMFFVSHLTLASGAAWGGEVKGRDFLWSGAYQGKDAAPIAGTTRRFTNVTRESFWEKQVYLLSSICRTLYRQCRKALLAKAWR